MTRSTARAAFTAAGAAYVTYMFGVDVPMYWARWLADEAQGRADLSVGQCLLVAVWLGIAVVHWPALQPRRQLAASAANTRSTGTVSGST